ncbi:MAG: sigma-54 dependent transcriptional regulator [Acidobacteriota bacterium]
MTDPGGAVESGAAIAVRLGSGPVLAYLWGMHDAHTPDVVRGSILVVDDEPKITASVCAALRRSGHRCAEAFDADSALALFDQHGADLVITDRRMPGRDGTWLLGQLLQRDPELPVVLLTAYGDVRSAVDAMKRGAFDYLTKPFDLDDVRASVGRALELRRLRSENRDLRRQLATERSGQLIADSPQMESVLTLVDRAARSRATVLIQGASGTGKEVIARRCHAMSPRAAGPFVAVNCKAFGTGVLESELFGHEKGAFTGAERARAGCFERADGGTLFLDEIGDVDGAFQAKLLRVLQEGEVLRVGGSKPIAVDVRVLAATHRDLRSAVADGDFREDLYYRLAVIPVRVPALVERPEDVAPLAEHFLGRSAPDEPELRLSAGALEALRAHRWPGNVRELQNVIERAVVLRGATEVIEADDLLLDPSPRGAPADGGAETRLDPQETLQSALDAAARSHIERALERHGGRRTDAARALGIDRTTLFRWIKRLGIAGPRSGGQPSLE